MTYILLSLVCLGVSGLTLFSGFGVGTLLLPVFALFLPVELAVVFTAGVHLLQNLAKLVLLGRFADRRVILVFGLPALLSAFFGARLLGWLSAHPFPVEYSAGGAVLETSALKLTIAVLMLLFALIEMLPALKEREIPRRFLPAGGILSGFFGGLSGHQGVFRSLFLIRSGLSKESFIGTGVVIAVMVDLARIPAYGYFFAAARWSEYAGIFITAVLSTLAGIAIGRRLMHKITIETVRRIVCFLLAGIALALGAGII